MTADLLFTFGFSITLLGILQRKGATIACGLVVAAFGRQTALALMVATWIVLVWRGRHKELPVSHAAGIILASAAVIAIFWVGSLFANATGATDENVEHLTGITVWLFSHEPEKLKRLIEFIARALVSQGPALVLLAVLLVNRARPLPIRFWMVTFLVLAVLPNQFWQVPTSRETILFVSVR